MFTDQLKLHLHVKSPLHAGTGDNLGVIDLPIQRERHTQFPKIEASGLKGSIRSKFWQKSENGAIDKKDIDLIFGPENPDSNTAYSSSIAVTDAKILLFPVKSVKGIFGLTTCPFVLKRYYEDMGISNNLNLHVNTGEAHIHSESINATNSYIVLDEYKFNTHNNNDSIIEELANTTRTDKKRIIILSDTDFNYYTQMATEVITRIKIDNETGVVAKGALFNEEFLPVESVLYASIYINPLSNIKQLTNYDENIRKEDIIKEYLKNNLDEYIQLGGDATIGKGIVKILI